jgi:hypothetical protein
MILASGVRPSTQTDYEIVPLIIDPHRSNDDLKRTVRLMQNYQTITKKIGTSNGFFGTQVTTFDQLVKDGAGLSEDFTFNLQQVADTRFKDYIAYDALDDANKYLANILFSGKSSDKRGREADLLDLQMDIGFVGNPNVGSVVLNQFRDSLEFREFASNFNADDRIFVISSIFGGTGAAGFPIVVKNIRNALDHVGIDGAGFLSNAKIGAISVLPYFNIQKKEKSPIQKSHFIAKAKSALYYYRDNITGNGTVNAMYYIADDHNGTPYENDPGDGGQQNSAHFVELAASLAIIDYLGIPDEALSSSGGKAVSPIFKEFGTKADRPDIAFADLEVPTYEAIALRLSQFLFFKRYLDEQLPTSLNKEPWSTTEPVIDGQFTESHLYKTSLTEFVQAFAEWIGEMNDNKRSFSPFNLEATLDSFVKGKVAGRASFMKKFDYRYYDDRLNKAAQASEGRYSSNAQKLIKIFFEASEEILTSKFGM